MWSTSSIVSFVVECGVAKESAWGTTRHGAELRSSASITRRHKKKAKKGPVCIAYKFRSRSAQGLCGAHVQAGLGKVVGLAARGAILSDLSGSTLGFSRSGRARALFVPLARRMVPPRDPGPPPPRPVPVPPSPLAAAPAAAPPRPPREPGPPPRPRPRPRLTVPSALQKGKPNELAKDDDRLGQIGKEMSGGGKHWRTVDKNPGILAG